MTGNHSDAQLQRPAALTWSSAGWALLGIVQALAIAYVLLRIPIFRLRLTTGLIVTISFAAAAWAMRAVTVSGAIAGALVAFSFYVAGGRELLLLLLLAFLLTFVSGKVRANRERVPPDGEASDPRSGHQILANLWVASILVLIARLVPEPEFGDVTPIVPYAALAALVEAIADTVASDIGETFARKARLITTFRVVPNGTDGAITARGTLAGVFVAALTTFAAAALGFYPKLGLHRVFPAAVSGLMFDSLVGATLQRRGWMSNNAVNLASTAFAALIVLLW